MEDFSFVADFDVRFYAVLKKCEALEDRQFAQYKRAMSASLKKSMNDAWLHLANLGERKETMKRFNIQQEKQIMEQKAIKWEMRDAESSIAATLEQVVINSDDEVPDAVIAAFKGDWKHKRQQGTMSKFKATSVNRNKKPSREPMKCWNCNKPGHRMAECLDVKQNPRSKGSSSYGSNDRSYVKSKSSMNNINANVNDNEDEADFHGLTRTIINKNSIITLIDTRAARSVLALSAYQLNFHGRLFTKDRRKPKLSQSCGDKISIVGSVLVKRKMGDIVKAHKLWVVRNMALDAIMGWDAMREFGAINDRQQQDVGNGKRGRNTSTWPSFQAGDRTSS